MSTTSPQSGEFAAGAAPAASPAAAGSVQASTAAAASVPAVPVVEFSNYSLTWDYLKPLKEVTFRLDRGESAALIGPAGSGKSLLLYIMSQLLWEAAVDPVNLNQVGSCRVLGFDVAPTLPDKVARAKIESMVTYIGSRSAWLPLSVAENFSLAQALSESVPSQRPFEAIIEALPLSGRNRSLLQAQAELLPGQVEPAILQQLALVRALLKRPALLLLDEPFLGMDPVFLRQTENLVLSLAEDTTVVWATNDLHLASRVTDQTIFLLRGHVIERTPTAEFFSNPQTREAENFIAGRDEDDG